MTYVPFLQDKTFESIVCDILKNGQAAKATATKKFSDRLRVNPIFGGQDA